MSSRLISKGNYENAKIEIELEVEENESAVFRLLLSIFGHDALFVELPTEVKSRTETNNLYERWN